MSRARDWMHPETGETHWFDVNSPASLAQVELLADVTGDEVDDLLDASLSQKDVHHRLNIQSGFVPQEVLERKRERKHNVRAQPVCAICSVEGKECEGRMTRHHFVPKWIMLELENYEAYASRTFCTVWVCAGRHRLLHLREDPSDKSIAKFLTVPQRMLAEHLIARLKEERPVLFDLIASGDKNSYEWQLIRDWQLGLFYRGDEYSVESQAAVLPKKFVAVNY